MTYIAALELGREHGACPSLHFLRLVRLHLHFPLVLNHVVDGLEVILGLIVQHVLLHGLLGRQLRLLLLHGCGLHLHHGLPMELQDLHGGLLSDPGEHGDAALAARTREGRVDEDLDLVGVQLLERRRQRQILSVAVLRKALRSVG